MADRKPLYGIRVLDFTHVISGPYGTLLLADAGADVVKVEPIGGEAARIRGLTRDDSRGRQLSVYYAAVDAGKRSISLDLKNDDDHAIALRLARHADVIVENFSGGVMTRLGLNLAKLRGENPRLITVSIRLDRAPRQPRHVERRGLSIVAEAESGLLKAREQGAIDMRPSQLGFVLGDLMTGMTLYAAVVTSLVGRERFGVGAHHDIGMIESLVPLNSLDIVTAQFSETDTSPKPSAGHGIFRASDGWITMGINSDPTWLRLMQVIGRPDLASDEKYCHYSRRDDHHTELNAVIEMWTSQHTSLDLRRKLNEAGVPCGIVRDARELLGSDELGYLLDTLDDGMGGTVRIPKNSLGYSRANASYSDGSDLAEVLEDWLPRGDSLSSESN